ncbi:hypothetical protein QTO34_001744 [Cnephaeus nilssonii]|uniref:Uncharacterized protein n=1 Tax=Cnephaeus nilssonii TaxID=3371016 RepID=A0AA40HUI8_CNENI|nr:hypothetical protein QTO34_001744 [Eptesicus nilssonii]
MDGAPPLLSVVFLVPASQPKVKSNSRQRASISVLNQTGPCPSWNDVRWTTKYQGWTMRDSWASLKAKYIYPKVTPIKIENLRQTLQIEVGYKEMNAWVEWIRYSVHALNKSDCYAYSNGMGCVLALYQEETAWGNASCKTLALLFPSNRGKELGPPK